MLTIRSFMCSLSHNRSILPILPTSCTSILLSTLPSSQDTSKSPEEPNAKTGLSSLLFQRKTVKPRIPLDPEYVRIYRYPAIERIRTISRMKVMNTYSFIGCLPPVLALEYFGTLGPNTTLAFLVIGSTLSLTLCLVGLLLNKFIGIIHYNSKKEMVLIAHLSFWGARVDHFVPRTHLSHLKKIRFFPMLSTVSDTVNENSYKIIADQGIIDPLVYSSIFSAEPLSDDSKPVEEKDVEFSDLIKKIKTENKKTKKE